MRSRRLASRLAKYQNDNAARTICSRAAQWRDRREGGTPLRARQGTSGRLLGARRASGGPAARLCSRELVVRRLRDSSIYRAIHCCLYGRHSRSSILRSCRLTALYLKSAPRRPADHASVNHCSTELRDRIRPHSRRGFITNHPAGAEALPFSLRALTCCDGGWTMTSAPTPRKRQDRRPRLVLEHCAEDSDAARHRISGKLRGTRAKLTARVLLKRQRGVQFDIRGVIRLKQCCSAQAREDDTAAVQSAEGAVLPSSGAGCLKKPVVECMDSRTRRLRSRGRRPRRLRLRVRTIIAAIEIHRSNAASRAKSNTASLGR